MEYVALSEKSIKMCNQFYEFKDRSSCMNCPAISECHKDYALSYENLNKQTIAINNIAENYFSG